MRKLHLLGLAFLAVFAFCAVAASSAFALEWLVGGAAVAAGGVTVDSEEGTLLLEDMKADVLSGEGVSILCLLDDIGLVLPAGLDTVNTITFLSCENELNCETVPMGAFVHLPWSTELLEVGGAVRDDITAGTGGEPGWELACRVLGVMLTDICVATTMFALVANEANGTVDEEFMENEQNSLLCTVSNATEGLVVGLLTYTALNSLGQAVSLAVS